MKAQAHKPSALMGPCGHVGMWTWNAQRAPSIIRLAAIILLTWAHGHLGTCAFGQSTGTLRITCEPQATYSYILDGKHRLRDRELTLMEGPHRLVFWAPERRVLDTTFTIVPNALTEARIQLRYSEEFIAFNKKLRRYERDDRWLRYGTPVLVLGSAAWFGVSVYQGIDARRDLDHLRDDYAESTSPSGITALKGNDVPDANKRLRQARVMAGVSGGLLVGSGALWWYMKKIRAKRPAPVFDDKEKARFDGLVWMPDASGQGIWMAGLTIPLR